MNAWSMLLGHTQVATTYGRGVHFTVIYRAGMFHVDAHANAPIDVNVRICDTIIRWVGVTMERTPWNLFLEIIVRSSRSNVSPPLM